MKKKKKQAKKPGLPPGTLIFTGEKKVEIPFSTSVIYNANQYLEEDLKGKDIPHPQDSLTTWIDTRGLSHIPLIEKIGSQFQIHPLVLEDILNPNQRPKFEEYEDGVFLVLQSLSVKPESEFNIQSEQVAIYFKKGLVLSFQEDEADLFVPIRERLEAGKGRIRSRNQDYLAYALIDYIIDNYFLVLDRYEEEIEKLEGEILNAPDESTKAKIHLLKLEGLSLRKNVGPLRELVNKFARSESPLVTEENKIFVRDLYDHIFQIMDLVESHRDVINGLYDLYLSEISYRMNAVMQVLTVIATLFIPITFIAGVFGMNFDHMPELHWKYGYPFFWFLVLLTTLGLIRYFRSRKWF